MADEKIKFPATFEHKDGRTREVHTESQRVAAEFDGFIVGGKKGAKTTQQAAAPTTTK